MSAVNNNELPPFKWRNVLWPVLLSMLVTGYIVYTGFDVTALSRVSWSSHLAIGLLLAAVTVVMRDVAYMYRIRHITGSKLSWRNAFEVIMLWEFGSAITPGAVGGVALAFFILKREGISYGRSTATILFATFLDNTAFVLVFSLLYLLLGNNMFVVSATCSDLQGHVVLEGIRQLADKTWIGYLLIAVAALLIGIALFFVPGTARNFLYKVANWPVPVKVKEGLQHLGDEVVLTSNEFRNLPFSSWCKVMLATLLSWLSRYLLANALIWAFSEVPLNQLLVLSRQYLLWVFIMIPSTPGASGLAEFSFMALNCEFLPQGLTASVALLWRLYSYYLYLLVGIVVMPGWLKRSSNTYNS